MTAILHFNPPVIAHRGASAYAPENTMAAFVKAAQLGIKWVEFDVEQALCSEPVIFHDETLERTTNAAGFLHDYPFQYLNTLDAGGWFNSTFSGERIPSLIQVMTFLDEAKISANVEIKALGTHEEKLILKVLGQLQSFLNAKRTTILFSSFSLDALYLLRKYSPHCLLGLLLHEWDPDWQKHCEELQCASVHVNEEIMTPTYARSIKNMGKQLLCYTVNDVRRAKELFSWGVDAVFSDVPDQILKATTALAINHG